GATGERFWLFGVPPERLYPGSAVPFRVPREVRPRPGSLGQFQLGGDRLFLVQGGRSLLALDVLTGEVLWQRRTSGPQFGMPAPRGRIHHLLPMTSNHILVQMSGQG